jgi:hypothetical protein
MAVLRSVRRIRSHFEAIPPLPANSGRLSVNGGCPRGSGLVPVTGWLLGMIDYKT